MTSPIEFIFKLNVWAGFHVKTSLPISSSAPISAYQLRVCLSAKTHKRRRTSEWIWPATGTIAGANAVLIKHNPLCTTFFWPQHVPADTSCCWGVRCWLWYYWCDLDYDTTDVITTDRKIDDKVVRAIKTKVHKFNIALLASCSCHCRHLVVDAHRVACVAGQLRQDIHCLWMLLRV